MELPDSRLSRSEAASRLLLSEAAIRAWESEGLVNPRGSGRGSSALYDRVGCIRLCAIKAAKDLGASSEEIMRALGPEPATPNPIAADLAEDAHRLAQERRISFSDALAQIAKREPSRYALYVSSRDGGGR